MRVAITVARFQVDELTRGHKHLLLTMNEKSDKTCVLLGCSPARFTKNNPLDFEQRRAMVLEYNETYDVYPLMDQPTDVIWSDTLDRLIGMLYPTADVTLYAGRDGFLPHYKGRHRHVLVETYDGLSGSDRRAEIAANSVPHSLVRYGAIHAVQNAFTRVNPTVDIAIVRDEFGGPEVLMGRKVIEEADGYRFVGGFIDPSDESAEAAAIREAHEETGLEIGNLAYLGSFKINDWRYRSTPETVMTTFFKAHRLFGIFKASDDMNMLRWLPISGLSERTLPLHRPLAVALEQSYFGK